MKKCYHLKNELIIYRFSDFLNPCCKNYRPILANISLLLRKLHLGSAQIKFDNGTAIDRGNGTDE